ncbi:N-acetyltransferase [Jeotgalibacillus sp. S-D1]|uniref:GNAT family N-acetyltransferase n=1 Tax=Jeotgalibacillus sp. S-D1 TaxID=2552189 RepID=UPI00105A7C83|nr:GNAT family N-acetyltransferase [Jeotgalibacillus sp. S-D1]TDL35454.1 N-acetyltransferase [Jeotgalibacillus sp. S-D1]
MNKTIAFRKVEYERDVNLLHHWMNKEYVHPYWNLNITLEQYGSHLKKALADAHHTLFIGYLDGIAMSYWEAYWVKGDIAENCYISTPFDQGIHLLIGEEEFIGKGFSMPLLRAMVRYQFELSDKTVKVIAEPDIRNEKMIHVFKKCGFESIKPVSLPDKTAMLMFCERQEFETRWLL